MIFRMDHLLSPTESSEDFVYQKNQFVSVDADGVIECVEPYIRQKYQTHIKGLVVPGLCNAHSHAFQIGMRGIADNPRNFLDWVHRFLYPSVEQIKPDVFRLLVKRFYRALLKHGVTTLGEFHYFHHKAPEGLDYSLDFILLEEAKKAGIRLALLQSAYNKGKEKAQKYFWSTPKTFQNSLDNIEEWLCKNGLEKKWSLSVAPHSLHGCSEKLLETSVAWAQKRNKKWHIHLAEQKSDIAYSQKYFDTTPLKALQRILGEKLDKNACLVHAIWLNDEEIECFKDLGLNLVYNPMTNMYLGDGICRVSEFDFKQGGKLALGTDSNNAFNLFQEAKTMEGLQRICSLEMGKLSSQLLLKSITSFSGVCLNLRVGALKKGFFADFIEINFEEKIGTSVEELKEEHLINHLIFSGFEQADIMRVFIGGEEKI